MVVANPHIKGMAALNGLPCFLFKGFSFLREAVGEFEGSDEAGLLVEAREAAGGA